MGLRPRRKSRLVLWLSIVAIAVAIIATALLANDKKNLRTIIQYYHIDWIRLDPAEPPKGVLLARRGKRLKPIAVSIPDRLPPHIADALGIPPASPMRRWRVSGKRLCEAFSQSGLDVGAWHRGDLYTSTYECSAEISGKAGDNGEASSLFLIVRGTKLGDVSSVRMKAILPDTAEGAVIREKFVAATIVMLRETDWLELDDTLEAIKELKNVSMNSYGARLSFAHEFMDERRYNLILDIDAMTPGQKANLTYFDRSKWLPTGPNAGN